jgi:hypothetical protein
VTVPENVAADPRNSTRSPSTDVVTVARGGVEVPVWKEPTASSALAFINSIAVTSIGAVVLPEAGTTVTAVPTGFPTTFPVLT